MKKYYTPIHSIAFETLMLSGICNFRPKSCEFVIRKQLMAILLVGLVSVQTLAQQTFPVVARFTQLPPYPVYLADFSNPAQTNLSIQVQQNDRTIASRPFRIRIYIEGNGFRIQSTDVVQGEPPLTLAFGEIRNLPAIQVANYFKQYNLKVTPDQYSKPFNEGSFRFGVEIIDFQTNRPLSGIQWANPVWITVNEPPVWVMPQNNINITPTTPQNITFQWAPRHTNVSDVEYEFTITELILPAGFQGNVQNIFLSQPPFYKTRTRNLTLPYNITLPPLVQGRTYAYRVQAIAKRGREDVGVFRNNGFSEIQSFKYGEPVPDVKPPTNLRIARNETGTGANFDWKGEPDHKNFTVEYREKGSQDKWTTANVKAATGNVYNNHFIPKLDEKKSYELRVVGINEANKSATSAPIILENVANTTKKEPEIAIQGTVQWAYYASEEKVKEDTKIIDVATSTTLPPRDIKHANFEPQKGSRKYPLANAFAMLFSSEDANITTKNYNDKAKNTSIIETVSSDADGLFKFKAINIKLLANVKNLYVGVSLTDNSSNDKYSTFTYEIIKVDVPTNAAETKILEPITLLANSLRFSPKILLEQQAVSTSKIIKTPKFIPWRMIEQEVRVPVTEMRPIEGNLTLDNVEEIALYRLQTTINKYLYLKNEGGSEIARTSIRYNNDTYIKVADFKNTATSAQLFYNKAYKDSFVFRIKQKDRDEVIYPVNNIEAFQEGKYAHITDYFKYTPPPLKLKGYVERRGKTKAERVANAAVQAFGTTVRTNAQGYFETQIPSTLTKGNKVTLTAIDPLNATNKAVDSASYDLQDITRTLVLKEGAHYVSSVVYDAYTRKPLGGAMVTYKGSTVKTDSSGRFRFVDDGGKMDGPITVKAASYTDQKAEAKDFAETTIGGSNAAEKKTEWLKSAENHLKKSYGGNVSPEMLKEYGEFYEANFTKPERIPSGTFIKDSILLNSEVKFRILTYIEKRGALGLRDLADSATYVASTLKINDVEKEVPLGGYRNGGPDGKGYFGGYQDKTTEKTIKVKVFNKDLVSDLKTYAEGEVTFKMPAKVKKDSIYTFTFRLRPTRYMYGIVYDSTMFIKGVHKDDDKTVNRPGQELITVTGAKVAVVHGESTISDDQGFFKLLVPIGQEVSFEITKQGYATTTTTLKSWDPGSYQPMENKKTRQPFYILQSDPSIPEFKTLLGFDIKLDKKVMNSAVGGVKTYKISGKVQLATGKAKNDNIYTPDKTKELTFKDIVVKSQDDSKNKDNAIPLLTTVNFVETEAQIKLFGYAPITLKGNHAGEPYIRLQPLLGKDGEGKIGASKLEFTQQTMMGIKFGEMELKIKEPEKEKSFGKFDDKVSKEKAGTATFKEQTKLEKELAEKKDEKKAAETQAKKDAVADAKTALSAAQDVQKDIKKGGSADDKKTAAEVVADKKKQLADAQYAADGATKVPEKEPMMLAFATSNLEELKDDKEFSIIFRKKAKEGEDKIKFTLGSVNLSSVGVGNVTTSAPGVSVISVLIDPSSAILKKSGVGMKGNIQFPQIWKFKTDKPLIIDKLDIDKEFGLKQVTFMKGDKGDIYQFGMADKWMFYITNFQIYNNFKGYGIGGTFNTDKDNYLNVKSFGLTIAGGKVYPNVSLDTPKEGIRFSKLRFKTMGKKTISFKGVQGKTPAEDGYEVEASLRIEYDDSEVVSTVPTDTTNKFGRRLSDTEIAANRAKTKADEEAAKDKADAEAKQVGAAANREKGEKALTELISDTEQKIRIQANEIAKQEGNIRRSKNSIENFKKDLEKNPNNESAKRRLKDLEESVKNSEQAIVRYNKLKQSNETKLERQKANLKKVSELRVADRAVAEAKKEEPKKEEPKKEDAKKEGTSWKDRLFPINLQVFQWSTAGKLLVSAAPSEKALDFGVVNVKIRRIVFTKASNPKAQVKMSEINDLLKLTEDEVGKLNSTTNFNDANMAIADGKREGVFDKDEQKKREAITSGGLSVKALSDKVAAEDPNASWALGFAGGIELNSTLKGLKFDSDLSMIVGDFGKGTVFQMNEIMLKLDGTAFRLMGKVKLATSGTKVGFEGAVDLETVKRKFAASFKFYKINDPEKGKYGIELGAAIQASTMIPMGSITWTSIGGGFDLNTADQKYKFFFLGSAIFTGTSEKVTQFKSINVSVEFDAKNCGGWPVIKGSMELWTNEELFCKTSIEQDFCKLRIIAKAECQKELAKTMVKLNALVVISKAGFFAGAMVEAEIIGMKANGIVAIGVLCNTASPDMPTELADYKRKLPSYMFQSDNVTFSGIYIGFELGKEVKTEGTFGIWKFKAGSYSVDLRIKGAASIGVNFSNGNFMIKAAVEMSLLAKASLAKWSITGSLLLGLRIEGGYLNDIGWNFLAQTYGNLQVYTGSGSDIACNDYRVREYVTEWRCVDKPFLRKCRRYDWVQVPATWYPTTFQFKFCLGWNFGVKYRQRGREQGWALMR